MRLLRAALVLSLLLVTPLLAQKGIESPIEQIAKLVRTRTEAPTQVFIEGSLKPNTIFRGKPLAEWLNALRDADTEGTARPAKQVMLAMGSKAIPFLIAAQSALNWDGVDSSFAPRSVVCEMGETAIEPLVRLLGSDQAYTAWLALGNIISQQTRWAGEKAPTKKQQQRIDARLAKYARALEPCLGSADAATRLAGVLLLQQLLSPNASPDIWGAIPVGARRLLDKDPRNEVRGAACQLLVFLGLKGVTGGLTREEVQKMAHPNGNTGEVDMTLPPEVGRAVLSGILLHMQRDAQKPTPPTGK